MLERIERLEKAYLAEVSDSLVNRVIEGYESALKVDVKLNCLGEIVKDARAKIKSQVKREAETESTVLGVGIKVRNGYANLNYSEDEEYARLEKQLKDRKELLSQSFKMHEKGQELVVDGEQIPVVSVKSYTDDSIIYSL